MSNDNSVSGIELKRKELMDRFLDLRDNLNIRQLQSFQEDLEEYLNNYEDSLDKRIENTCHLVKSWINYRKTDELESSYELVLPMLMNLEVDTTLKYTENNYNKWLLVVSVGVCKDYNRALQIVKILEKSLEVYPTEKRRENRVKIYAYVNLMEVLSNTKRNNPISGDGCREIEDLFSTYAEKAKKLCREIDMYDMYAIITFNESNLYNIPIQDKESITESIFEEDVFCEEAKNASSESEVISIMLDGSNYKKKIGARIRREREALRMSLEELAGMVGISSAFLGLIERGNRGVKIDKLARFADIFGLTVNDFVYTLKKPARHNTVDAKRALLVTLVKQIDDEKMLDMVKDILKHLIDLYE